MALNEKTRAKKSLTKLGEHLAKYKKLKENFRAQYELAVQYYQDARHYFEKGDYFTSFGCSDYAYGLLDAIILIRENQNQRARSALRTGKYKLAREQGRY